MLLIKITAQALTHCVNAESGVAVGNHSNCESREGKDKDSDDRLDDLNAPDRLGQLNDMIVGHGRYCFSCVAVWLFKGCEKRIDEEGTTATRARECKIERPQGSTHKGRRQPT
jgi:hypothetical protein